MLEISHTASCMPRDDLIIKSSVKQPTSGPRRKLGSEGAMKKYKSRTCGQHCRGAPRVLQPLDSVAAPTGPDAALSSHSVNLHTPLGEVKKLRCADLDEGALITMQAFGEWKWSVYCTSSSMDIRSVPQRLHSLTLSITVPKTRRVSA